MKKKQQVFFFFKSRVHYFILQSGGMGIYKETSLFVFSHMNMLSFLFIYTMQPQEFKGLLNVFNLEVMLGARYSVCLFFRVLPNKPQTTEVKLCPPVTRRELKHLNIYISWSLNIFLIQPMAFYILDLVNEFLGKTFLLFDNLLLHV